jgi:iron complex outermembrane recepter protein
MSRSTGILAGAQSCLLRVCHRRALAVSIATVIAAGGNASAQAQQAGEKAASDTSGIEEIVVTARRREEKLMSIPDTVSVFGPEQIESMRLNEIGDFGALTPNVKIIQEQDSATNTIFIRGIGSNRNEASAVAFVIDGVVLPDPDAFTTDLSDAERVEILKGPQGALYGKGALAGAINITTRQPTDEFHADASVSYGSGHDVDIYSAVAGPISGDKLLGRFSIKYQTFDGTQINQYTGRAIDYSNFIKPSLDLVFKATDALTFKFAGSYYSQNAGNPPYTLTNLIGPPGDGTGGIINNTTVADTPIVHNDTDNSKRKIYDGSLTIDYDTGFGNLTSISAYDKIIFSMQQDLDFSRLPLATAAQVRDTRGWSEELRFTSPGNLPFRYIVGTYFQNTQRYVNTNAVIDLCLLGLGGGNCTVLPQVPSGILLPLHLAENRNYDDQYAGFGQINYDLTNQIELTAALRYDRDDRSQFDYVLDREDKAKFDAVQPKASIAYKISPEDMVYATYAVGYKSGLFNTFNTVGGDKPLVVKPEGTNNVELGTKNSFLERRILFTAAAYYTKYKDAQEYSLDIQHGGQATVNVQRSRLYGFEADVTARPVRGLNLSAAYGYTKSKIQDFNGTSAYIGQPLPSTPLYTLNLAAQYTHSLPGESNVSGRVDFAQYGRTIYQDFQNPNTNEVLRQVPYNTVNAQIAFARNNWTATVYGKNILSEHYVTSAYSRYISPLIFSVSGDLLHPAPVATVGGEVRVRF